MTSRARIASLVRLLALEALFNSESGQRWGWLCALRSLVPASRWRELQEGRPERLNVTPPFAGLLVALWSRHGGAPEEAGGTGAGLPLQALSSTLSARADRLLWGSARPGLFTAALAGALVLGARPVLLAPLLWAAGLVSLLAWGLARGSRAELDEMRAIVASRRWSAWENRWERAGALALGMALAFWFVEMLERGAGILWGIALPAAGILVAWRSGMPPLTRGLASLLLALAWALLAGGALEVPLNPGGE